MILYIISDQSMGKACCAVGPPPQKKKKKLSSNYNNDIIAFGCYCERNLALLACMYNPDQTVKKSNMPRPRWRPLSAWPLPSVNAGATAALY